MRGNLIPNTDPGLYYQFWKKNLKISLEKNNFLKKSIFFQNYNEQNVTFTNFNSVESLNCEFTSETFCLHFIQYLHVWIRDTDPDLESSWIRIRIHAEPIVCNTFFVHYSQRGRGFRGRIKAGSGDPKPERYSLYRTLPTPPAQTLLRAF